MLSSTLYPHLEQEARLFALFVSGQNLPGFFFTISLALEEWLKWQTNFHIFKNSNFIRLSSNNEFLISS